MSSTGWIYGAEELASIVYDTIKDIKDPEKPATLEDLNVVYEEGVSVEPLNDHARLIKIEFTPTVSHCSLATLIGLCIRVKLKQELPEHHKIDIVLKHGSHVQRDEVNKQINDKERVAAALENPNLKELVEKCINYEQ